MGNSMSVDFDFEWYLQHQDAFDTLSVEQVHELGRGGVVPFGETDPVKTGEESSGSPAADPEESSAAAKPAEEVPKENSDEKVILAKDGKNTIPFSVLEEERAKTAQLEQLARDKDALIAELQQAKKEDKGTGATEAQDEVLKKFKTEFEENYPDLGQKAIPYMEELIKAELRKSIVDAEEVSALKKELAELKAAITPLQNSAMQNDIDVHFAAIRKEHADFEQLVESGVVDKWIETLPKFAQPSAKAVMEQGSAKEVIELFSEYKKALGEEKPSDSKEQLEAKAKEAIEKAKTSKITSLTDLPKSSGQEANEEPSDWKGFSKMFGKMTPAQIRKECGLPN